MITMDTMIQDPNTLLRTKSETVNLPLSNEDEKILNDMIEYVTNSRDEQLAQQYNLQPAVGIAAVQTGHLKRMCVVMIDELDEHNELQTIQFALINPVILSTSKKEVALQQGEGCLSIREPHEGLVYRPNKIKVRAFDYFTQSEIILEATGYLAIVIQHEVDHLNGILYYDRINKQNPWAEKSNAIII